MATAPWFVLSPNALLSVVGLLRNQRDEPQILRGAAQQHHALEHADPRGLAEGLEEGAVEGGDGGFDGLLFAGYRVVHGR